MKLNVQKFYRTSITEVLCTNQWYHSVPAHSNTEILGVSLIF